MAQGGDAGLDKLGKLAHMPINYTGERRERNPQRESLTEIELQMQENVFKDPFALPPERMDLGYPTSIQNITLNLDYFETDKLLGETVKDYNLTYTYIDSPITSEVLEHDFQVIQNENPLEDADEQYGAVGGVDSFRNIQPSKTPRPLSRLADRNAELISVPFSTIAMEYFGEPEHACRPSVSLRVLGEVAPINIIVGEDDILDAGMSDETPTIRHIHKHQDLEINMRRFKKIRLSLSFHKCKIRDHILYYWYHNIIKVGHVYWMAATDDEKYVLHDLTSTFNLTPYIPSSNDAFDEMEINATRNAMGLLYYTSALYRWQNKKITPDLRDKTFELCERASKLINNKDFPIKWCLSNIIYSDICIPLDTDLNDPMLWIPMKMPNDTKDYRLRRIVLSVDACREMEDLLLKSLKHLRSSIDFLVDRHLDQGTFPLVTGTAPDGSRQLEFNLEELAAGLVKIDSRKMRQVSLINVLDGFVVENDLDIRLTVYALRKLYVDCVVQARIFQRNEQFPSTAMFSETALVAWVMMTNILSENRMPLPLRPVYMLGDACYRFSLNVDKANSLLARYIMAKDQKVIKSLVPITIAYDINRTLGLIKRGIPHFYVRDSFECFARAILYSEVIPDEELLKRICIVANDLVFSLLEMSDENNSQYTGETNAKRNLDHCKLLLDGVFNLVVQFTVERKLLVAAYVLKARFLRIGMHQELKRGDIIYETICRRFVQIKKLLDKAFVVCDQLDIEIQIGKNLVTMERTVSLTDYIFRLRYKEVQNQVSYHKDIIPSYVSYVEFCRSRFEDEGHDLYFKFRAAVGYASLAEYLFGLYKEKKNNKIRDEAELWFEEADKSFQQLHRYSILEIIKTRNDRLTFYDFLTTGQRVLVYDSKTITILLKSLELLYTIPETEYKQSSRCVFTNNKRVRIIGVLKALEKRLQSALHRRALYERANNNIIDISRDKIRDLYLKSLNTHRIDLLCNLKSVLEEIRVLKNNNFRV